MLISAVSVVPTVKALKSETEKVTEPVVTVAYFFIEVPLPAAVILYSIESAVMVECDKKNGWLLNMVSGLKVLVPVNVFVVTSNASTVDDPVPFH